MTAQHKGAKECGQAQETILAALGALRQGIAVFDDRDRMVMCNAVFRSSYPLLGRVIRRGVRFETLAKAMAEKEQVRLAPRSKKDWLSERLAIHSDANGSFEEQLADGSWRCVEETRAADGSTTILLFDITEQVRSREHMGNVLESISASFLICDANDKIVRGNNLFNKWIGQKDTPVLAEGASFEDYLHYLIDRGLAPEHACNPAKWLKQRMAAHRQPGKPVETRFADGRVIQAVERKTSDGGTLSVFIDITRHKNRENVLERTQSTLRTVLETIDQGISMFDADLKLVAFNSRLLELQGVPDGYFKIGDSFEDIIREFAIKGEYGEGDIEDIVRKRIKIIKQTKSKTYERVRPEGQVLEVRANPVPGGGGYVTTFTDVTERRNAEEALRTSEERYALAMEGAGEGLWEWDISEDTAYLSRRLREFFGEEKISKEDVSAFWIDRIHPEDRERHKKLITQHIKGDSEHFECEMKMRNAAGDYRWVLNRGVALRENGRAYRMAGSILDITDHKRAEQDAREARDLAEAANIAKGQFLATMSHELRTPLNAIIGFSEMMKSELFGALGNAHYAEYASDINESGNHLLNLINDILDVSKLEAGKIDILDEACDVGAIIGVARLFLRERAMEGDVEIDVAVGADLPALRADERRLKQILINLMSNAVKFTSPGGKITVTARAESRLGFTIEVRDTGIGIAPDDIARALEPFAQIDSTLSRRYEGTGLGLPLTKSLIELHAGQLEIESELGVGTLVTVTFPPERILRQIATA